MKIAVTDIKEGDIVFALRSEYDRENISYKCVRRTAKCAIMLPLTGGYRATSMWREGEVFTSHSEAMDSAIAAARAKMDYTVKYQLEQIERLKAVKEKGFEIREEPK